MDHGNNIIHIFSPSILYNLCWWKLPSVHTSIHIWIVFYHNSNFIHVYWQIRKRGGFCKHCAAACIKQPLSDVCNNHYSFNRNHNWIFHISSSRHCMLFNFNYRSMVHTKNPILFEMKWEVHFKCKCLRCLLFLNYVQKLLFLDIYKLFTNISNFNWWKHEIRKLNF